MELKISLGPLFRIHWCVHIYCNR